MKVFNQKIPNESTLDDIESLIYFVKKSQKNEFDFADVIKLCELLGAEYSPKLRKGGSAEKFQHKILKTVHGYTNGIFTIHVKHKGGDKKNVKKRDLVNILFPTLEKIIKIKKSQK